MKADLEPFNCISEECQIFLKMFSMESQWAGHIRAAHLPGTWICRMCPRGSVAVLESEADFTEHLEQSHAGMYPASHMEIIARGAHRPAPAGGYLFDDDECPMRCGVSKTSPGEVGNAAAFNQHIAQHLLSLALESLPERSVRSSQNSFSNDDQDTESVELLRRRRSNESMVLDPDAHMEMLELSGIERDDDLPYDAMVESAKKRLTQGSWILHWITEPPAHPLAGYDWPQTLSTETTSNKGLEWIQGPDSDDDPIYLHVSNDRDRLHSWSFVEPLLPKQHSPISESEQMKEPVIKSFFKAQGKATNSHEQAQELRIREEVYVITLRDNWRKYSK